MIPTNLGWTMGGAARVWTTPVIPVALALALLMGCARVDPDLRLPALEVGRPSFAATMAAYTGAAVTHGNRVNILLNGEEIFPAKIAAIRAARQTINYA